MTLDCEMLSSPDTLRVLLAGFAEIVKAMNYIRLWDAELAWSPPKGTRRICLYILSMTSESTVLN